MLNSSSLDKYQSSRVLVENNTGSTIPAFKVVQLSGMGTTYPQVVVGSPSSPAFGLTIKPVLNSSAAVVYCLGFVYGIDTSAWTSGTLLYCDASGNLATVPVSVGDQPIALCVNQDSVSGILYVLVQTNQYHGSNVTTLTGDVTGSGINSIATTIPSHTIVNSKLAQMPANTVKGNNTAATADPIDLTIAQLTSMLTPSYVELHVFTGYTGPQTGTYSQPFNTLQGAINSADPLTFANTIIYLHDSPNENIVINNLPNGLTIQAYATSVKDNQSIKLTGNITLSGSTTRVRFKDFKVAYPGGTQPDLIDQSQGRNYFSNMDFGGGGGIQYSSSWARWHEFVDCTINGNVSIAGSPSAGSQVSMWRTRGAPTFTLNSSNVTLALYNNENLGTITQTNGSLIVDGGSGFAPGSSIISTANSPDTMNLLNVSLQTSGSTFAQINKTGTAPYNISNVWRNDVTDILTGTRQVYGATSADQKYTPLTPNNWNPSAPANTKDALDLLSNRDQSRPRPNPFTLMSQTLGPAVNTKYQSVTLSGNYAYLAGGGSGATMTIFDISNQAKPILKSYITLLGSYQIAVQGNYAYVPSSGGFVLYVVNISDPTNPTVTGSVNIGSASGSLYSCVVSGNYCYISTQSKGLTVIDVTNPAAPTQVYQEGGTLNKSFGVAISGTTLYTTNYQTTSPWTVRYLKTWDVSTPTAPTLLNTYTLPANTKPGNITLSGNTAFVADINVSRVHLIDITTPSSPNFLSTVTPTGTFGADFTAQVTVANDAYLYVPSGSLSIQGGAIDMFDITTLTSPIKVATTYTGVPTSVFGGIQARNGYIYAADYGISPGSTGTLDVFAMPYESLVAGNIVASTISGSLSYTAGTPSNWATSSPTNVKSAIDRIAALLVTLNGGNPIP